MSNWDAEVTGAFRAANLRTTPQRYAVLDFLLQKAVHPTADEIWRAINRTDPRASRATVYNSLNALVGAGLVREVLGDSKAARFDAQLRRHHHFVCEGCGALDDIPWFSVTAAAARRALGGRSVNTCEVVFRGLCERCQLSPMKGRKK
jgi:Fe2+ or Zn2+ uptake regulation protein